MSDVSSKIARLAFVVVLGLPAGAVIYLLTGGTILYPLLALAAFLCYFCLVAVLVGRLRTPSPDGSTGANSDCDGEEPQRSVGSSGSESDSSPDPET